jgi:putative spermidine/putrescine transport system substrate-binding protein
MDHTNNMALPIFGCLHWLRGLSVLLVLSLAAGVQAQDTLRVLTWPGYADHDLVKAFEQRTGSKVEVTFIDSEEVMWQKLSKNKAEDFDVFAVNTAELQRFVERGLVVPINTTAIPNIGMQLPRFRDVKIFPGWCATTRCLAFHTSTPKRA